MNMGWPQALIALVAVARLAEVVYAERNARRLLAQGWAETGARHYPLFVMLHGIWLVTLFLTVPASTAISWGWLGLYLILQMGRAWVLVSLGRFWTTRIISKSGETLVSHGPYRFVRHPNYLVVAGEVAVLPMIFGAWQIALIFSVLNGALLWHRIRIENRALAERQSARGGKP